MRIYIVGFAIVCATAVAGAIAERRLTDSDLSRDNVRDAIAQLDRPATFDERHPSLRFLAYLFADEAQPHLRAISELARSHDPEAAPPLIRALENAAFPYRFEAGVALQDVPHPGSVAALIAVIEQDDPRMSRMAARVLGRVAAALGRAPDPVIESWAPGAEANAAIDRALEALIRFARQHSIEVVRVAALTGLISIGTEDAFAAAFEIGTNDSHDMVRCRVLSATGDFMSQPRGAQVSPARVRAFLRKNLDPRATAEPLGVLKRAYFESIHYSRVEPEALRRSDCVDANETALWWLASLNDPEVIPRLIEAAQSDDPGLQAVAAWGLPRFNSAQAFVQTTALLDSPYSGVRSAVIDGLGRSKYPDANAVLMRVLEEGSRIDRRDAARALAGSFGASLALINAFSDRAVEVRDEAERALMRSEVVVRKLEDSLARAVQGLDAGKDTAASNKRVQRIREGLAKWQGEQREAERALASGLDAADPLIRKRSARILSRYASDNSFQLLLETLRAARSPSSEAAALALGLRGDVAARRSLERAAASDREELSIAAVRALQDLDASASLPMLRVLRAEATSSRTADALRYTIAILERVQRKARTNPVR